MRADFGNCPCKKCDNRHVGCHGRCANYQEWRKARGEALEKDHVLYTVQTPAARARHNQYLRKYGRRRI